MKKKIKEMIQQNQHIFSRAFCGKKVTDEEISQAEQELGLKIPESFTWFLKEFGSGGYWFEILGYCKSGRAEFVEETLKQRKNGLPKTFLIIEDCDEFYYCLDAGNGKVASWSQYDAEDVSYCFRDFYEFFMDNIENAIDNNEETVETKSNTSMEMELAGLYNELANTIIAAIPMEWEEFHYLGEVEKEKRSWSSVFFVKEVQGDTYVKCFDLPSFDDRYGNEMDSILLRIYDCFIANDNKPWEQLCLSVKNMGDFKVNFKYDVLDKAEYGQVEREIIWAYETFGGKPQNSPFLMGILNQYLKKKNGNNYRR